MEQELLININKNLEMILKLMLTELVEKKSFDEKILLLSNLDYTSSEIAKITGSESSYIRKRKGILKKRKK